MEVLRNLRFLVPHKRNFWRTIKMSIMKRTYLDLSTPNAKENLMKFRGNLQDSLDGKIEFSVSFRKDSLTLSNMDLFMHRFSDFGNRKQVVTRMAPDMRLDEKLLCASVIARRLAESYDNVNLTETLPRTFHVDFNVVRPEGIVCFNYRENLRYKDGLPSRFLPEHDGASCLRTNSPEFKELLFGKEPYNPLFHISQSMFMSCNVEQDFAFCAFRGDKLMYLFESSIYEKTPKNALTGENPFLGQDLIEFHTKNKNFGPLFPEIFGNLLQNFRENKLDELVIDLRGSKIYTDGTQHVRRFERDYATAIRRDGELKGMLVSADVFFQDVNETGNPYQGAPVINHDYNFHRDFVEVKE